MTINEWFQQAVQITPMPGRLGNDAAFARAPQLVCADGFKMSVQASSYHYCSPRVTGAKTYWAFEVGFPSEPDDRLMPFAEDYSRPTETVYGWVPADVIDAVIATHGGIKRDES